jgi:hypothetical protein
MYLSQRVGVIPARNRRVTGSTLGRKRDGQPCRTTIGADLAGLALAVGPYHSPSDPQDGKILGTVGPSVCVASIGPEGQHPGILNIQERTMPDPEKEKKKEDWLELVLPAFITHELHGYVKDAKHATRLELSQIRPDTQLMIAKALRDALDPNATPDQKGFGPSIPLPIGKIGLPGNLTLKIWGKDITELSKGKPEGAVLNYELYRW